MLTPSQLVKRLRNHFNKHEYQFDSDDIIDMFDGIETHDIKSFNKYVKSIQDNYI